MSLPPEYIQGQEAQKRLAAVFNFVNNILQPYEKDGKEVIWTEKEKRNYNEFVTNLINQAGCHYSVLFLAQILLQRLFEETKTKIKITERNYISLSATAIMIASKVADDLSMVNADFAIITGFSNKQLNSWERDFLAGIKHDVSFKLDETAKLDFAASDLILKERIKESRNQGEKARTLRRRDSNLTPSIPTKAKLKRSLSSSDLSSPNMLSDDKERSESPDSSTKSPKNRSKG